MTITNIILIITASVLLILGIILKVLSRRKVKEIESPPAVIKKKEFIDKKIVGKID